jgi:hypothetical protein
MEMNGITAEAGTQNDVSSFELIVKEGAHALKIRQRALIPIVFPVQSPEID